MWEHIVLGVNTPQCEKNKSHQWMSHGIKHETQKHDFIRHIHCNWIPKKMRNNYMYMHLKMLFIEEELHVSSSTNHPSIKG